MGGSGVAKPATSPVIVAGRRRRSQVCGSGGPQKMPPCCNTPTRCSFRRHDGQRAPFPHPLLGPASPSWWNEQRVGRPKPHGGGGLAAGWSGRQRGRLARFVPRALAPHDDYLVMLALVPLVMEADASPCCTTYTLFLCSVGIGACGSAPECGVASPAYAVE